MRKEYIEAIRKACIKANPEIEQREPQGFKDDPNRFPIRLADVLLAIAENNFEGFQLNAVKSKQATDTCALWNLRKDSLADQSNETITFLHSLLSA